MRLTKEKSDGDPSPKTDGHPQKPARRGGLHITALRPGDDFPAGGILILGVQLLSLVDLVCTIFHVMGGGGELNPIMAMALEGGITAFGVAKVSMTTLGLMIFLLHLQLRKVRVLLKLFFLLYAALVAYHLYMFWRMGLAGELGR